MDPEHAIGLLQQEAMGTGSYTCLQSEHFCIVFWDALIPVLVPVSNVNMPPKSCIESTSQMQFYLSILCGMLHF